MKRSKIQKERWKDLSPAVLTLMDAWFSMPIRDATISACAAIDACLAELLHRRLLQDEAALDAFLGLDRDGGGSASNFAVRIQLAYLVGLIGTETERALRALARIRNALAHRVRITDDLLERLLDRDLRLILELLFSAVDSEHRHFSEAEKRRILANRSLRVGPATGSFSSPMCLLLTTAALILQELDRRLSEVPPIKRVCFEPPRGEDRGSVHRL